MWAAAKHFPVWHTVNETILVVINFWPGLINFRRNGISHSGGQSLSLAYTGVFKSSYFGFVLAACHVWIAVVQQNESAVHGRLGYECVPPACPCPCLAFMRAARCVVHMTECYCTAYFISVPGLVLAKPHSDTKLPNRVKSRERPWGTVPVVSCSLQPLPFPCIHSFQCSVSPLEIHFDWLVAPFFTAIQLLKQSGLCEP